MLSIVALPAVVCLRPHGHPAVGAPDDSLEQVVSFRSGVQGLRATAVLLQHPLDRVEKLLADQRLVRPGEKLAFVRDLAGVEGIMKDAPH